MSAAPKRQLTWADCDRVFEELHQAGLCPLVVGGQALNLWIDHYGHRASEFSAPIASKDIDVVGTSEFAERCAQVLAGRCKRINRLRDALPMNAVVWLGDDDQSLRIDFQAGSEPNTLAEIEEAAVRLPTAWGAVQVMHPLHCVKSRTFNVLSIWQDGKRKYDNPHGLAQLSAAMTIFRAFAADLAQTERGPKKTLRIYENLFEFTRGRLGERLWDEKRIDLFGLYRTSPGTSRAFPRRALSPDARNVGQERVQPSTPTWRMSEATHCDPPDSPAAGRAEHPEAALPRGGLSTAANGQ